MSITGGHGCQMASRAALLATFDEQVRQARALLAATSDASMIEPWTLKSADRVIMSMPRVAVMRSVVMNHLIHHRAQLAVYLRMNDVPVPSTNGPSADEASM